VKFRAAGSKFAAENFRGFAITRIHRYRNLSSFRTAAPALAAMCHHAT